MSEQTDSARRVGGLGPAHAGYSYQDLCSALLFAEAVARGTGNFVVDHKFFTGDILDDLTFTDVARRERLQFKYLQNADSSLDLKDFTTIRRGLKIGHLITSLTTDIESDPKTRYKIVVAVAEISPALAPFLEEVTDSKMVCCLGGRSYKFSLEAIWPNGGQVAAWARSASTDRQEVARFVEAMEIEISTPRTSFDRTKDELLDAIARVLNVKVGIGRFPNEHVLPHDAARRLVEAARRLRNGETEVASSATVAFLEKELALRKDFGRVAQAMPVDHSVEVNRESSMDQLQHELAVTRRLLLVGPPGAGKSWLLDRLSDRLRGAGQVVAVHYCYLEPGDAQVELRILISTLCANLVSDLLDQLPQLRNSTGPVYAADVGRLQAVLDKIGQIADRSVVLIVDGLDHIQRVRAVSPGISELDVDVVTVLSELRVPTNVRLLIGSQPGEHLSPLQRQGTNLLTVAFWEPAEVVKLATRFRFAERLTELGYHHEGVLERLTEKSDGNPLMATYLIKGTLYEAENSVAFDPLQYLAETPSASGDLNAYYRHLVKDLPENSHVADILATIDFSVSEDELSQIVLVATYLVPQTLKRLKPVLVEASSEGGYRVFHESFRRFVLNRLEERGVSLAEVLEPAVTWLQNRGFLTDDRSYRHLLPLLRRVGQFATALSLIGPDFVTQSLAQGYSQRYVSANLEVACHCAEACGDFGGVIRLAQLQNSAYTAYQTGAYWLEYARTFMAVHGASTLARRLTLDERPTFSRSTGLELCSLVQDAGARPPWETYLGLAEDAASREDREQDRGSWVTVEVAQFHGICVTQTRSSVGAKVRNWIRKLRTIEGYGRSILDRYGRSFGEGAIAQLIQNTTAISVKQEILRTYVRLCRENDKPICQELFDQALRIVSSPWLLYEVWSFHGPLRRRIRRKSIQDLTSKILGSSVGLEDSLHRDWFASIVLANRTHPSKVFELERQLVGQGWYRCWLIYLLHLAAAEIYWSRQPAKAEATILKGFAKLTEQLDPFTGSPRACDLYGVREFVIESFGRGLKLIHSAEGWQQALDQLQSVTNSLTVELRNDPSGPLTAESFCELLIAEIPTSPIPEALFDAVLRAHEASFISRENFQLHARFSFMCCHIRLVRGERSQAEALWLLGCQYLGAYGEWKDSTLHELLSSVPSLARVDRQACREVCSRLQRMVEIVHEHTTGKGTKNFPNEWFEGLLSADFIGACTLWGQTRLKRLVASNWILESAVRDLAAVANTNCSPLVAYALWRTLPANGQVAEVRQRVECLRRVVTDYPHLTYLATDLAAAVQGDPDKHSAEAVGILTDFFQESGLQVPDLRDWFPKGADNTEATASTTDLGSDEPHEETDPPAIDPDATALQTAKDLRAIDPIGLRSLSPTGKFADSFYAVLESLADVGTVDDIIGLLQIGASRFRYNRFDEMCAEFGQRAEQVGKRDLASICMSFAFTTARGLWGWSIFGDETRLPTLERAYELNDSLCLRGLMCEASKTVGSGSTYGVTVHLIQAGARINLGTSAFALYEETEGVINERLPAPFGPEDYAIFEPYSHNAKRDLSENEAAAYCLLVRLGDPNRETFIAATGSVSLLARHHPEVIGRPSVLLFASDVPPRITKTLLQLLSTLPEDAHEARQVLRPALETLSLSPHYAICQLACALLDQWSQQ